MNMEDIFVDITTSYTPSENTTTFYNFDTSADMTENSTGESTIAMETMTKKDNCEMIKFVVGGIFTTAVGVIGFVLNGLSLFTLWPSRSSSATYFLLIALAVMDISFLLVTTVKFGVASLCQYFASCTHYIRVDNIHLTAYFWSVGIMCQMTSNWTVVLVTFHRYIAACYPLKVVRWGSVRAGRLQFAIVFLCCVLFKLPKFFEYTTTLTAEGSKAVLVPTKMKRNLIYDTIYYVVLQDLFSFILPFVALIFMTFCLIRKLRAAWKKRKEMTHAARDNEDLTLTLVVVVVVFLLCQLPNPIRKALAVGLPKSHNCIVVFMANFAILSLAFNSSINFIIYCLFGKRFRILFRKRMCSNWATVGPGATASGSLSLIKTKSTKQPT